MLILERRLGERIVIGDGIVITVTAVGHGTCRLGIEADRSVPVVRGELLPADWQPAGRDREGAK